MSYFNGDDATYIPDNDLNPLSLSNVLHTRLDGQVFCVEQHSDDEFQAVYPSDLASLSGVYLTFGDAMTALRYDLADLGITV